MEQGKRYRFRFISNGIINCPMKISVDNHKITIISSDGQPIEPFEVCAPLVYSELNTLWSNRKEQKLNIRVFS